MNLSDFNNRLKNSVVVEFALKTKEYFCKYKFALRFLVIFIICLSSLIAYIYEKYVVTEQEDKAVQPTTSEQIVISDKIKVYVTGEVKKPGVYTLTDKQRVEDAIKAAGGATENTDLESINLSQKLSDEQYINVPSKYDEPKSSSSTKAKSSKPTEFTGVININSASAAELDKLPGIGEAIANRIVEYRTNVGNFTDKRDIMNIKGIGPSLYEKIKNHITI